jgi:hypothetical protein
MLRASSRHSLEHLPAREPSLVPLESPWTCPPIRLNCSAPVRLVTTREKSLDICLVRSGDEAACNDFHNRIHGEHRSMSQWRWEFMDNTFDRTPIPFVCAKDGDRIVGTQAFIPIRMIDREGVFWTAKSEATLVDPDYRGQHIFEKMYEVLFHYAEEHEFAYIWGFTPAIKAFTRLQFEIPGETQQLYLPYSARSVTPMIRKLPSSGPGDTRDRLKAAALGVVTTAARILSSTRFALTRHAPPSGLDIRIMEEPDERAGALCDRFINQWGGTTIYRDSQYLRWRLFENPYVKSVVKGIYDGDDLLGWVAFTLGDDGLGYLVDILASCDPSRYPPGRLVRSLLLEAILGTRNMGATGLRGWRVNQHPFDRMVCREARKVGFYHIKRGHSVVLFTCPAGRGRPGGGKFDDWFVSRIYTEGVLS